MKTSKLLSIIFFVVAFAPASNAQKLNTAAQPIHRWKHRQEIVIPQILGYNVYKADLHTHTIYSDGDVTPAYRVREAWRDGLDIVAITDHIEVRVGERDMLRYMNGYIKEEYRNLPKGVNTNLLKDTTRLELGILPDLNAPYEQALSSNQQYGLLVIRGAEISRQDHFNALFTTDNNKIYHPDLETSLRNAKEQGAFIIHNHPKKDKSTVTKMTPTAESLHAKGLIDGIEVVNSLWVWRWMVKYCLTNNYAPISGSDVHGTIEEKFFTNDNEGFYRNMTLILAHDCSEASIKEALFAGRTIAYYNNELIGKEEYLSDLFRQSVSLEHMCDDRDETRVVLTNRSPFPYMIKYAGKEAIIHAMGAVQLTLPKSVNELDITVTNLVTGAGMRPKVKMPINRKPSPYLEQNKDWNVR